MTKRLHKSALITLIMLLLCALSMLCAFGFTGANTARAESTASVWDGNLIAAGWGDTETSKTPVPAGYVRDDTAKTVQISSAAAFAYFAHESNLVANNGFKDYTVSLECDIDLNNKMWIPIGFATRKKVVASGVAFRGAFDGKGHTVSNFNSTDFHNKLTYSDGKWAIADTSIEVPTDSGEYNYGLIAATADTTIKNLTVTGVKISLASKTFDGQTAKTDSVGAIVGMAAGNLTVENCAAGSKNGGDYIKNTVCTGGLVGRAYAGLSNGVAAEAGARTPDGDGYLSDEANYGEVKFENCVNYVNITENANNKIGGILGYVAYERTLTFANCVNYGNISCSGAYSGGIVSYIAPQMAYGFKTSAGTIEKVDNIYEVHNCVNYGDITGKVNSTGGMFGRYEDYIGDDTGNYGTYTLSVLDCKNYGTIDGTNGGGISSYVYIEGSKENPAKTSVELLRCFNYGDIIGTNTAGLVTSLTSLDSTYKNVRISGGNSGKVANTNTDRNDVHKIVSGVIGGKIYDMYDRPEHKSAWDIEYLIDAYKIVDYAKKTLGSTPATATLVYADADKTEITGVNIDADGPCKVTVPASVKKIGFAAFAGKFNITEVVFEEGSQLTDIDDWAFGGTSVKNIVLPQTVKHIGVGAFGDCINLANVTLPDGLESIGQAAFGNSGKIMNLSVPNDSVDIGDYVLDADYLWIAKNKSQYEVLTGTNGIFADKGTDFVTYPITVKYIHKDVVIDTETRLFGHDYQLVNSNGKWVATESTIVGTIKSRQYTNMWYCGTADSTTLANIQNINAFLKNTANIEDGVAIITAKFNADKVYVARTDLVYNETRSYALTGGTYDGGRTISVVDANKLLTSDSAKIPDTATVTIKAYYTGDGQGKGVPLAVHDAGTYAFRVQEGSATYDFSVSIARVKVDLASTDNLDWKLSKVGSASTAFELLDSRGMLLYLYSTIGGGQYPSLTPLKNASLTQEQKNLGIDEGNYRTKIVRYSVVRNRETDVEISIANRDEFWVTHSGNARSAVGMYTAVANLNATDNYTFVQNGAIQDNDARGVTVTVAANGRTATVEKVWYIVDINNWFVSSVAGGGEYVIEDREYGSGDTVPVPNLMYGDISEYGSGDDPITLSLYREGLLIGEFKRNDFGKYINSAMPIGKYRLSLSAKSVTYTDPDDATVTTECNSVSYDVVFNVEAAALPQSVTGSVQAALKGLSFTYDWDGQAHWYDTEVTTAIDRAFESFVAPTRTGTIWEQGKYDELYGTFVISFSLLLSNENYYTVGDSAVSVSNPGLYRIYYKISAVNYIDSIAELAEETRADYYFTITIIREVEIPTAQIATYNGEAQKADIPSSEFYTVNAYDGFANAGEHSVTLTLTNSEYYRWAGKEIGEAACTVKFVINKSINDWLEAPDIVRWVEGKFNEEENTFIGAAKFGEIIYIITDADDNVLYDAAQGINKLASLKAGKYFLRASVAATDNYTGLSEAFTIRVLEKIGLPWWGTLCITLGALLIAAIIILILWKKGVFQILTGKIVLAIRTRASVDATIASVRAAKRMEEGKKSVAEAKRRERMEEARRKAEEQRALPPEERAAIIEAKAQAQAEKAEKMRLQSEAMKERAKKVRGGDTEQQPTEPEQEAATAVDDTETPTEE